MFTNLTCDELEVEETRILKMIQYVSILAKLYAVLTFFIEKCAHFAILVACRFDCKSMLKLSMIFGVDINAKDEKEWTYLHFAAKNGALAVAKVLVEKGISVDSLNIKNQTPLDVAVENENMEMVDVLSNSGANINISNSQKLLSAIARNDQVMFLTLFKSI